MSDKTNQLKFEDALPQLVTAYREGILVPFLGSGMSMGVCTSWHDMLIGLLKKLDLKVPDDLKTDKAHDSKSLYRVADEVIGPLEAQPLKKRAKIYRAGLSYGRFTKDIPSQTKALAGAFWPLVITTNYDDVYWKATPKGGQNPAPTVLGRDRRDCHEVLSSLDLGLEPLLWCIQGFVGGQLAKPKDVVRNRQKRERLLREVVIGHQQYQRATNDAPHFRRAFAEVCRRRSLLFLGSGITEDYLINLFSEIRHHHGPSRRPHFALLQKDDHREDEYRFMELRLGIVPILYEDENHSEIPEWLKMFADEVRKPPFEPNKNKTWKPSSQMIAANYRIGKGDGSHIDLEIKSRALQKSDDEAIIISVGKSGGTPLLGRMAQDVLPSNLENSWKSYSKEPNRVFQHKKAQWLFAIAARKKSSDYRDLGIIPEALASGLEAAAKCHSVIHVGAIASGPESPWHPAHPFVQMLCGIRKFVASNNTGCAKRIVLHIVDWRVWLAIWAKKVVIPELLFSGLVTYSVDLESYTGDRERFSVTMPANKCLKDLLKRCGLKKKQWKVELKPSLGKDEVKDVKGNVIIPPSVIVVLRKK